ncbi:MAG: ABC transporter ATP-binding protein [Actinomycetes bacterium]
MTDHPALRLTGVHKRFGATVAVDTLDLEVRRGTITALLGPSGCGKTTALRCIAGLERPDAGTIEIDGEMVAAPGTHVPAERRRVGMVFQDYALFPHLTVLGNVEYGLHDLPRRDRRAAAMEALDLVGLAHLADRTPDAVSGGQRQRVALARALAPRPDLILLDEPFSNLDAALRATVREDVRAILKAADATAVFVTHDQEEALSLADEVAVMADGHLHQVDAPFLLYTRPATAFVARFVGDADVLPATRLTSDEVLTSLGRLPTVAPVTTHDLEVVVRPEMLRLLQDPAGDVVVEQVTYFGHDQLLTLRLADGTVVRSRQGPDLLLHAGDRVRADVVGPVVAFPAGGRPAGAGGALEHALAG